MIRKKPNFTAETFLAELDNMRVKFKKSVRGHRRQLYQTLADAQRVIARLLRNATLRRDFERAVNKRKKASAEKRTPKFRLETEVVAMATGARSRSARQVAWKRGRVLNHLRETGVKVEDTAKTLESKGGIEKILRIAAMAKAGSTKDKASSSTGHKKPVNRNPPLKFPTPNRSNNQEVLVKVWMRLSARDELSELAIGSRVTMSAIKVGQVEADFKISRIEGPPEK